MENKEYAELKMQIMFLEHLVASMFAAQQRGTSVNADQIRQELSLSMLKITQGYYQTDQTASPEGAAAQAQALWVEGMGNQQIDHMFGLIRAYMQRG
jgi:hypothetical protein